MVPLPVELVEAVDCQSIQDTLNAYPSATVFCYVWATWCVPCKTVGPRFEALAAKYGGQALFLKIDADGCVDFLRANLIKGIPVILALQAGIENGRLPGEPSLNVIEQFIQEHITGE